MLHPHTKLDFVDDQIGYGVFATRFIPVGTVTWTLDPLDQVVPADKVVNLSPQLWNVLEHYAFLNGRGDYILCWDFARFMNHSCDPTALAPGMDVEIAVRDILPGEQLTGDYGAYNLERDLPCRCGASSCRGTVKNSDFDLYAPAWDAQLQQAVARVHAVEQPLWDHVADKVALSHAAADPLTLPTCTLHRMAAPVHRATPHG